MEPFVEQLKRLCAAHPTRAKWVLVPSHSIGRTLGDRLVMGGTDWANLRFITPLDIALRMGAPFLVERGIDPSEEGLGPALVMRLLLGLESDNGYFRPLAYQPELARALWSTITELRLAGLTSTDLKPDGFASPEKHAELQALLAAYESFLTDNKRGDRATVLAEAMYHPDWCPIQPQDCWAEMPDTLWSPLECRLIAMMPGERITPEALALPGTPMPRRLAGTSPARVASNAPLARLLAAEPVPAPQHPSTSAPQHREKDTPPPVFFVAGGNEAEIEEVMRRVLTSGAPLDDVEICAASHSLPALIWEKCLRYEWPVTMADGIPASMTRPGRALLAFAEWIEDDFAAGRLRKMLQSGDVRLRAADPSDPRTPGPSDPEHPRALGPFGPSQAAKLLLKAQCAWGRDTYRLALGRLARTSRTRAERDDIPDDERKYLMERALQCDALAAWIDGIIRAVLTPEPANPASAPQLVARAPSLK
jgi:hypothetical protein